MAGSELNPVKYRGLVSSRLLQRACHFFPTSARERRDVASTSNARAIFNFALPPSRRIPSLQDPLVPSILTILRSLLLDPPLARLSLALPRLERSIPLLLSARTPALTIAYAIDICVRQEREVDAASVHQGAMRMLNGTLRTSGSNWLACRSLMTRVSVF